MKIKYMITLSCASIGSLAICDPAGTFHIYNQGPFETTRHKLTDCEGHYIIETLAPVNQRVFLEKIEWAGCSDDEPNEWLVDARGWSTTWGQPFPASNCTLKSIRFRVEGDTTYISNFNALVPDLGSIHCSIDPRFAMKSIYADRSKLIHCYSQQPSDKGGTQTPLQETPIW